MTMTAAAVVVFVVDVCCYYCLIITPYGDGIERMPRID